MTSQVSQKGKSEKKSGKINESDVETVIVSSREH